MRYEPRQPMTTQLFTYPGAPTPATIPDGVRVSVLPASPAEAAAAIWRVLDEVDVVVCWDTRAASIPWLQLARFESSLDDAWHPGTRLTGLDNDPLRYVIPLWVNRPAPDPELAGAINWRLDLRACFLRASAVKKIGGLDGGFDTLTGTARELGLRLVRHGGVCRQQPSLWSGPAQLDPPTAADRYRLVAKRLSRKWPVYAALRAVIDGASPREELRGLRAALEERAAIRPEPAAMQRPLAPIKEHPTVSVVLPTYGRYKYIVEVLEDLRAQTIRPTQIIIADGNPPEERQPEVYEAFRDLPLEVFWDEVRGMCAARNQCLARATGEYVWFVDDDSRFSPDNLEQHLRVLATYGAEISVGPAYTRGRPELHLEQREVACSFMDCGTTVVKKDVLDSVGGFDMQFNALLPGEDGELGVRFVRSGALMVNNPFAKRFHYLAPVGGGRRSAVNLHRFSRWSTLPRPVQTIHYTARRHFEPGTEWDAVLIAGLTVGWRRRDDQPATIKWFARTLLGELAALPMTAYRIHKSRRIGEAMMREGPQIPRLSPQGARSVAK